MHTRRSNLPALSLATVSLPRPGLTRSRSQSTCTSSASSPPPTTPRNAHGMLPPAAKPRTSTDSWGSFSEHGDEDDVDMDWTDDQRQLLLTALDILPTSIVTPFNGPVPPNNYLDKLAREIKTAHEQKGDPWPHSIRSTRVQLLDLAKVVAQRKELERIQEIQQDGKENVRASLKRPLYRQSSMDFLPTKNDADSSLGRASKRLQRTDRIISPNYHPYPRRQSRPPSPPADPNQNENSPKPGRTSPTTRSQTLRKRSNTAADLASHPPIKRVSSLAQVHPPQAGAQPRTPVLPRTPIAGPAVLPAPTLTMGPRMRRTGSFSAANPMPVGLKRAPSFSGCSSSNVSLRSVATVASALARANSVAPSEAVQQDKDTATIVSSDDDEKIRQRKSKRARTGQESAVDKGICLPPPAPETIRSPRTRSVAKAQAAAVAPGTVKAPKSPKAAVDASARTSSASPRAKPATNTVPVALSPSAKPRRRLQPKTDLNDLRRSPSYFGDELPSLMSVDAVDATGLPFRARADSPVDMIVGPIASRARARGRLSAPLPVASSSSDMDVDTQTTVRVAVRRQRHTAPQGLASIAPTLATADENDENNAGSGSSSQGSKRTLRRTRVAPFPTAPNRRISFSTFLPPPASSPSVNQPSGSGLDSAFQL